MKWIYVFAIMVTLNLYSCQHQPTIAYVRYGVTKLRYGGSANVNCKIKGINKISEGFYNIELTDTTNLIIIIK